MPDKIVQLSLKCLNRVLRPIAKFCLRRAVSIQDISELMKRVFIEVGKEELEQRGEKANVSKLSAMTGMHRRDVMRLLSQTEARYQPIGLTSRIVGQWEQDKRFCSKAGSPKVLTCDSDESEFAKLVQVVSKDLHPGTILAELERLGMVKREKSGVRLQKPVEVTRRDPEKGYAILGLDISDLITAAEENIFGDGEVPNLHARTEYDNVFLEDLPKIRDWLLKEGSAFHQRARTFLSKHDADINPHGKKRGGGKVVLGTFSKIL